MFNPFNKRPSSINPAIYGDTSMAKELEEIMEEEPFFELMMITITDVEDDPNGGFDISINGNFDINNEDNIIDILRCGMKLFGFEIEKTNDIQNNTVGGEPIVMYISVEEDPDDPDALVYTFEDDNGETPPENTIFGVIELTLLSFGYCVFPES